MHLVGHHAAVQHPADHGEQQQALEDPALPAGAHPVSHVGPAPLPTVCARKPVSAAANFRGNFYLLKKSPHSLNTPRTETIRQAPLPADVRIIIIFLA